MKDEQAKFFDYIYPEISKRLHNLERNADMQQTKNYDLKIDIEIMKLTVSQYKKKIQRIEQLLIEHGLLNILKKYR